MLALGCLVVGVTGARGETCGDTDGNDQVTVTDGVNVLRAAAGLPGDCPLSRCDVDGSGAIAVTDGVNVLRSAAGLSAALSCVADPFIASVQGQNGVFGSITKIPGGLTAPPAAPSTITNVLFSDSFVEGRINTVTVEYDATAVQAQSDTVGPSLLVASARDTADPSPGGFALPLDSSRGSVSVALDLKPDLPVQQFALKIANGAGDSVAGQVVSIIIVVIRESTPTCGNRVVDAGETCDPPGFGCPFTSGGGFCNASCTCELPIRFVDNGDGTVTDNQTGLQWEKKTGTIGFSRNECSRAPCPDPHDVNNEYPWCLDANHDDHCDTPGNPADGETFTDFLFKLNTPPCFAGHCDWRLPTVNRDGAAAELETILDAAAPACGSFSQEGACIDPIFGPTIAFFYWSATPDFTFDNDTTWLVDFHDSSVGRLDRGFDLSVRAVRTAR